MKQKRFLALFLLAGFVALLSVVGVAAAGYSLDWWTVAGGGAGSGAGSSSTGGPYSLGGTIGQPDAGTCSGGSYTLTGGFWAAADSVPPTVLSSTRIQANPTSLTSVDFTVTFFKPVSGVDTTDFTLTISGLTGASVTNVSGGPSAYTVTVSTGSGNGTLRLDVVDDDSIIDSSGNPLGGSGSDNGNFSGGEVYTVTKTFSISGNAGVGGATISYTGGSITAGSDGDYHFTVNLGWTGSMIPSLAGYRFVPPEIDISSPVTADLPDQDFTAHVNYTIFLPLVKH